MSIASLPTVEISLLSTNLLLLYADIGTLILPVIGSIWNEAITSLDNPLERPCSIKKSDNFYSFKVAFPYSSTSKNLFIILDAPKSDSLFILEYILFIIYLPVNALPLFLPYVLVFSKLLIAVLAN